MGVVEIPETIATGCDELDLAWSAFASQIHGSSRDHDLPTRHAFLGHNLDMQGWRAVEFVGVDAMTKDAPGLVPLIDRGVGVRELRL